MKLVCPLAFCAFVLLAPTRLVSAADDYGRDINSPSDNDPTTSSQPADRDPTPEEQADMKKQQQKQAADQDWMARGVEEYRSRNGTTSDGSTLYERLSSNKELAKLAGISVPDNDADNAGYRTGVTTTSGHTSLTLRTDPSEKKSTTPSPFGTRKPFIRPFAFLDKALPRYVQPPAINTSAPDADTDLLDSPGMTAAAKNPLLNSSEYDLKFDISTFDAPSEAKTGSSAALAKGRLPISSTADRLPTAPGSEAKPIVTAKPLKIDLPEDLQPAKPIPFSPVHPPIADTHDILYR